MGEFIKHLLEEFILMFNSMSAYLLFGFFIAGVLKVYVPQKIVGKLMGGGDLRSVVNAALVGVPLPLCSCGVIPAGVALYRSGASKSASVSFLISTPQTGVDSLLVSYSMIGLPFALIRVIVAFTTGIIGGMVTNFVERENNSHEPVIDSTPSKNTTTGRFKKALRYGFCEFLMSISKSLLQGIALAALLAAVIPNDFFSTHIDNEILSMLMVLAASVPLYICATGSVPIVAVLMMKGLSPGAALIFLMAGPATNLATINVIRQIFGNKTLLSYLISIIGGALLFGFGINRLLPQEWFTLPLGSNSAYLCGGMLPPAISWGSTALLIGLMAYGYTQQYINAKRGVEAPACGCGCTDNAKNTNSQHPQQSHVVVTKPLAPTSFSAQNMSFTAMRKYNYRVEGLTCNHCKMNLEKGIKTLKNVNSVVASPANCTLEIVGNNINVADVERVVLELGFIFKGEITSQQ